MSTYAQAQSNALKKDRAVNAALRAFTKSVEASLGFSLGPITTVILRGTQLQATLEPGVTTVYAIHPVVTPSGRTKRRRKRPITKE